MLLHLVEAWRELLLLMLVVRRRRVMRVVRVVRRRRSHMQLRMQRVLRPRLQLHRRVLRLRRHRLREDGDRRARRQRRRRQRLEAGVARPGWRRTVQVVVVAGLVVHVVGLEWRQVAKLELLRCIVVLRHHQRQRLRHEEDGWRAMWLRARLLRV
jgi:hypothetical protein